MNKKDLLSPLKEACKYINKRKQAMPILTTLKIEVKENNLTIYATDLTDWFTCTIPTDYKDMQVCVPAKIFRDQINVMDAGDIQLEYLPVADLLIEWEQMKECKNVLCITQGRSTFNLLLLSADEYPAKPANSEEWNAEQVTLASGAVATIYHRVPDSESSLYVTYEEKKTLANNLFPKYLKIDGAIAKKNRRAWIDYVWHEDKRSNIAYCMYQSGNTEQKISNRELENYEVVKIGKEN